KTVLFYDDGKGGPVIFQKDEVPSTDSLKSDRDTSSNDASDWQHDFVQGYSFDNRLNQLIAMKIDLWSADKIKSHLAEGIVSMKVSAVDATDTMPSFSSMGPTTGKLSLKPDLTAPGVEILSTIPKGSSEVGHYRMSGTSMASPHVAGAAALIKQLRPEDTTEEIKSALSTTADSLGDEYSPNAQGSGRLNVLQAAKSDVVAIPNTISFGVVDVTGDTVQTQETLTLTNRGDVEESFDLNVNADFPSKAEMTIEPSSVTIPAGEEVEIELNITADTPDEDMDLTWWVEAEPTAGNDHPSLRIPFYAPVHFMQITVSPDPAFQQSEAFIYSPVDISDSPTVTIESPSGKEKELKVEHDHDRWWRAPFQLDETGVYHINTTATTEDQITITGTRSMESVADEKELGWKPIGPNGMGGAQLLEVESKKVATIDTVQPGIFVSGNNLTSWNELRHFPMAGGLPRKAVVN